MAVQLVLFLMLHLLHNSVSQTVLTSDVPTNPVCPNAPVVFTCTVEATGSLRWIITNGTDILLIQYTGSTLSSDTPRPGIETELTSAEPRGGVNFDYGSTLAVSAASVLGDINTVVCDGGGTASEMRQTVELRSFPTSPNFTCTLPGGGMLRLNWIDTGDAVTEYRECDCTGPGCSCVPMQCGSTTVCDTNLAAGQEQTFSFTAVNCGDQESNVSTLTTAGADVPAAPVLSEVRVRYDQSTGDLVNIMATWNRMNPSVVVMDCTDEIGLQYTITCGGSSPVNLNTNCDSSSCWYELSRSSGCTLSVTARNAVGTNTSDTSAIQDENPLTVEVSDGTITCPGVCNIVYGTDPNNRNLTAVSGQAIPGLLPDETYFYLVTQTINSQVVEVEGSFMSACDCLDLIDRQLFSPLPVCSGGGGTITGAINNGEVTYTSLALNSGRATYRCDGGFSVSGSNTRECQGDGSWSGTLPTCEEDDSFPLWVIAIIVVGVVLLIAIGFIVGHFIYRHYVENYPCWLVVTIVVLCFLLVGIGIALYILIRRYCCYCCCCCSSSEKPRGKSDEHPLRVRATSDGSPADVERAVAEETAATYADPNTIERQEFPGTHDVYTVVDTKKKTPKPEDQLPTYQAPESIKREAAPTTGELYTVPENKKGSKKKKETTPPEYSQVDLQKKHQPPSGLLYSQLDLPPSGKTPAAKTVEYTDIKPHS